MGQVFNRKFLRLFGATFAARAVSAIGNLLLLVVIAQLYGIEVLGQFSLGLSILVGGATFARFGSDMSLLRHGSIAWTARDRGRVLGLRQQALCLAIGLSLGLSICLFLAAEPLASGVLGKSDMATVLRASAIILPAFTLMFLQSAWLKVSGLPQFSPLAEMGGGAFLATAAVAALHFSGLPLQAPGLVLVFGAAILSIFLAGSWIWRRRMEVELGPDDSVSAISYEPGFFKGLPDYALSSLMTYFTNWGVVVLTGMYVDYDQVAALTVALRVVLLVQMISTVIMSVLAPHFGPLYAEKRLDELKAIVHRATFLSIAFGGPITLSMILVPGLWAALFGAQLQEITKLIPALALARLVNVTMGPVGLLLYMTGYAAAMRRIVLTVSSLGIAIACAAIPFFGVYGAAGAVIFIVCTQDVAAALLVKRYLGFFALPVPYTYGNRQ